MRLKSSIFFLLFALGTLPAGLMVLSNLPFGQEKMEKAAQQKSLAELHIKQLDLQNRVESLKESLLSMALIPGARDVVGYQSEVPVALRKARKRFPRLISNWLGDRREVLELHLFDRAGEERMQIVRNQEGALRVVPLRYPVEVSLTDHFRGGWDAAHGSVYVSDVDVDHSRGSAEIPHLYSIYMATPLFANEGGRAGVIILRIGMSDFLREYENNYWLTQEGRCLHQHQSSGPHQHERESLDDLWCGGAGGPFSQNISESSFSDLKQQLAGLEPFTWKYKENDIAWLPVKFTGSRPTLWVGQPVDFSAIDRWLRFFRLKILAIALVLGTVVYLVAEKIASKADRQKNELLEGIEHILSGREVNLEWRGPKELSQLAVELNVLGRRYAEIHRAHQAAQEELQKYANQLEMLVEERTAEVQAANEQLKEEIAQRIRTEEDLLKHQEHLDELVQERTQELTAANQRLLEEVGERHKAQQALRENEKRLEAILDSVNTGIFIVDMETREIVYANPAVGRIIGVPELEMVLGAKCYEYFSSDRYLCPAIDPDRELENFERELIRADGQKITVLKTVIPLLMDGRQQLLESMIDITEMKRIARENRQLQKQLLQSQKLEAVGVLAGGIAHDFNNLLTVIRGFTQLAVQQLGEGRPVHEYLLQVEEGASRATDLVRQLLLFSRKQRVELGVLDLNHAVDSLLKMLRRLIGEDIKVDTRLQPDLWPIYADAGSMDQVLMNLAVNARDAMAQGGSLTITTTNVVVDPETASRSAEARPGRFVCLEVADTGEGMHPDVLEHIFEPFFTTKEAGFGTGLGLAVVYGIVKQHEGWIETRSQLGEGTSFRLYFSAAGEAEIQAQETAQGDDFKGDGKKILLVEDDEGVSEFAAATLTGAGYLVRRAGNAQEAREYLANMEEEYELLLTDVVLPGTSGVQLAKEVGGRFPRMAILLASGYPDQRSQWPEIQEMGFSFLQKPYTIHELLKAVRDVLHDR